MDDFKEIIDNAITSQYLSSDINDIRSNLLEYGVDLEENRKKQEQLVKRLNFKLNATINTEKDNLLLEKAIAFQELIKKGLDKPVAYLNELINQNKLAVQYKNLDKFSIDEIKEIIKDQNFLEILEDLEDKQ